MVEEPTNGDITNDQILSIDSENFEQLLQKKTKT